MTGSCPERRWVMGDDMVVEIVEMQDEARNTSRIEDRGSKTHVSPEAHACPVPGAPHVHPIHPQL